MNQTIFAQVTKVNDAYYYTCTLKTVSMIAFITNFLNQNLLIYVFKPANPTILD